MLKSFTIDVEPEVFDDIQDAVDYYNRCKSGLGKRFYNAIDKHFSFLKRNYLSFAVRYEDIRCMKVKNFPYMIHYRVLQGQKIVSVKAVFCTYGDPQKLVKRIEK